jgi:PAS domain S-box-containing protein
MIARDPTDAKMWLLSLPPTRRQTQWVVAVAVFQVAAFALLAPFAKTQLAQLDGFIPAFEGVIFVTDLVTSVLLFSQFAIHRLRALLVLACGYLFSALIIIPHALTFPGVFSPTGLLGAGLQTTAWLYWFWHLPFSLALLGYGLMRDEKSEPGPAQASSLAVIVRSVALIFALACGLTLLATAGHDSLPVLFADRIGRAPATYVVAAITMLACVSALAVLWLRRRSLLDQWLVIVALAVILEIGIAIIFTPAFTNARFTLGFYAGRLFSLLTSTTVLAVLLVETTRLYAQVARSNEDRIRRLVDANILGICIWNIDGAIVSANEEFLRMLQYSRDDVVSGRLRWIDLTPAEWGDQDERAVAELRSTGTFQPVEKEYFRKDGTRVPVLIGGALFEESRNEGVAFVLDLTARKRAELLLAVEKRSLEMISAGASLDEILNYLCNSIDALASGPISTVLMMDPEGHQLWHVAGPRVPQSWLPAIMPRPIGPCEGCCGTAAYRKERVIVADVLTDPVWSDDYRGFAVENGIRAAWSQPLLTKDGEVLGTFALYSAEPGAPTAAEIELIEGASHIALIAMVQQRSQAALRKSEEALRESERRLRSTIDGIPGLVAILAPNGEVEAVNR